MHQVKTHKTVEQIAKKHRLNVSFVKNQLKMGIPIEHEHTKDKDLATDIALQHLDEIPDYYTRLKKMESNAKKEHKKFKDVKENCEYENNAVDELETGLKKLNNTSYNSIDKLMRRIMKKNDMTAKELHNLFVDKHHKTPDVWIKGKTIMKEDKKTLRNSNPCWKGYKPVGTKKKGGKTVPNCVPVQEQHAGIRYCPKCQKDETRDECKYGAKYWEMFSLPSKLSSIATSNPHYHSNSPHPGNMPEEYNYKVEYSNWRADFGLSEDWQKINRKDRTNGLSRAAVKAYRKEHPGSKLQTAVTEKSPTGKRKKRRANFCRRMRGMKSKLTSKKTARDPNSRINKALRRWRCR